MTVAQIASSAKFLDRCIVPIRRVQTEVGLEITHTKLKSLLNISKIFLNLKEAMISHSEHFCQIFES